MAAETHHYVPRFVLRQFLSNVPKEHVSVYDKREDKQFVTSIKNIMSERRFNEFQLDDYIVIVENIATKIEQMILPGTQGSSKIKGLNTYLTKLPISRF